MNGRMQHEDDLSFGFTFTTSPQTVEPQISQDIIKPLDFIFH